MPRFVILEHDHPFLHWDFMLEADEVLRTWRLCERPTPGRTVRALPLGTHRLAYLDYEGPVSGNRGSVIRCDSGTFTWEMDSAERVIVRLNGERGTTGRAVLEVADAQWRFTLLAGSERADSAS